VANVVHANLLAADAPDAAGRVLNAASGRSISLLELLAAMNDLLGTKVVPRYEPSRAGDIRESTADIALARALLRYEPQVDLHEGLRRSIDYYRTALAQQ
jgi:UDP-glucose 4-epimerase